ncbi:MAG: thioredoxin family protein [Burkholderiales bacterium]|nr:thioredoxin family protein [Burkholderiales bacterium]
MKQLLAFPLYLTVVWLVWVLGHQLGLDAATHLLAALVLFAAAAWAWGRVQLRGGTRPWAGRSFAVVVVVIGLLVGWPKETPLPGTAAAAEGWQPWSEAAVDEARAAGRGVFVDFTAAWCVTCQVNKRLVLQTSKVEAAFRAHDVLRLQADWTQQDPAITAALARLGRSGVPVYVLYRPGGTAPELLPELLTTGVVLDALAALPQRP